MLSFIMVAALPWMYIENRIMHQKQVLFIPMKAAQWRMKLKHVLPGSSSSALLLHHLADGVNELVTSGYFWFNPLANLNEDKTI